MLTFSDRVAVGTVFKFVEPHRFLKDGEFFKVVKRYRPNSRRGEIIVSTTPQETIIACSRDGTPKAGARTRKISLCEIESVDQVKLRVVEST